MSDLIRHYFQFRRANPHLAPFRAWDMAMFTVTLGRGEWIPEDDTSTERA